MEGHLQKRLVKQAAQSQARRITARRRSMVQGNVDFPVDEGDEVLGLLSASLQDQRPKLWRSVRKVSFDYTNVSTTDSILKQRNLNGEAEPCTGGTRRSKMCQAAHQASENSTGFSRNTSNNHFKGSASAPSHSFNSGIKDDQCDPGNQYSAGMGQVAKPSSIFATKVLVQRNLQTCKAQEKTPSVITNNDKSDSNVCYQKCFDTKAVDPYGFNGLSSTSSTQCVSTFQNVLDSSWTSASLHRSMLEFKKGARLLTFNSVEEQSPSSFGVFSSRALLEAGNGKNIKGISNSTSCTAKISHSSVHHPEGNRFSTCRWTSSLGETFSIDKNVHVTDSFSKRCKELQSLLSLQHLHSCDTYESHSDHHQVHFNGMQHSLDANGVINYNKVSNCSALLDRPELFIYNGSHNVIQEKISAKNTKREVVQKLYHQSDCHQDNGYSQGVTGGEQVRHKGTGCQVIVADWCFDKRDQRSSAEPLVTSQGFIEDICVGRDGNTYIRGVAGRGSQLRHHPLLKPPDATKIYGLGPSVTIEESGFLVPYRHRLLSQCFRTWSRRMTLNRVARAEHRRQMLKKGLSALKWAVRMRSMQADTVANRLKARLLSQCFYYWKAAYVRRKEQLLRKNISDLDMHVEDLRRRLIDPSNNRLSISANYMWKRQIAGLQILRAAEIHYNLTLLCKHWVVWRQLKIKTDARRRQEHLAVFYVECTVKRKAFLAWSTVMHKRFLAKEQIRIHTLTVVFGAWSAQIQCVRAQRREQDRLSAEFHQMTRLRCSFQHWRLTLRGCQRRQEKVQAIARMAAWHWRQTVQKRKLEAAGSRARRVLDRRRRAVAFKTWCDVKASSDAERGKVKILRHLLDLRKLQAAFATWRRAWSERRRAQLVLEGAQRRSLQRCFEAWRSVLQQKSISVSYRDKLQRQVVELCFQGWRRSLELFHRRKMFVIHLFEERRWRARETVREYKKQEDQARGKVTFNYSLEDLLLQQTFHKWIEERCKLQRAREFTEVQEQKRIRAIVRQWHKLAEQAVHERVQRFSARLEQLGSGEPRSHTERSRTSGGFQGPGPACHSLDTTVGSQQQVIMERDRGLGDRQLSLVDIDDRETDPIRLAGAPGQADEESSPQASSLLCSHTAGMDGTDRLDHTAHICTLGLSQQSAVSHKGPKRLKVLVRSAVITIMHRSMSTAFFQWRKYTLMGRDERSQIDHFIDRRSRSVLSWAIGMWKTEATHQISAKKCWETRLLTSSVALWKGFVLQQKCEGVLQKKAVEFCSTHLLTLSFTMWKRKRRLKIIPRNAEEDLQLERRAHWLRRTVQRVRLRRMFTLWAARVRQSHKVQLYHTRALQTRVFVAWGRWVKEDRERKARAEGSCQLHCYRLRFSMWRASLAQRLDIKRKAAERSEQCARTALLRWHSYTRNKCQLQRLLSNSLQNQNRTVKIRILLIWTNATHNMKRADTFSQQSLKNRCLQRWHIAAVRAKGIQSQLKAFQIGKTEREMRRAFSQWKKHYCLNQEEVQQRERRTQCLVRRAALRWRRTVVLRRAVTQQTRKQLGYALKRWRLALAGRQAAYTRVRPVAKAWLRHTQQSRARQQRVGVFHRESQRCCLAACLGAWVFAYQFSVTSKGFWARGQCRRMLRAWHDVTLATQMHREQVVSFLTNTRQGIVALCFAQWRSQLWQVQQRYRTLELRLSDQQKSLKATVMHSWILATRGRQVLKLHHRAELKQWFNQWKGRTESSKLAEQFFTEKESRRLRLVLVYWLSWVKETKERQLRSEAVSMCVRHRTVSHVFHVWVRAKRRQAEALRLNCIHLLHRAFLGWQIAVQGHRRFSADVNRKLCTLRMQAAFNTWRKQLESLQTLQIQAEQTTQKQEQRVLRSALRTWRHKVQSLKYRTAYLSKKYCSRWIQVVFTNHTNKTTLKRTQAEDLYKTRLCGTFLRKWRNVALLQRFHRSRHRRSTKLLWDRWKNHAAATLFTRNMYERRLLEKAWITWRKRRIQTRVSMAFAVQQDRVLVRVVFSAWREHLRRLKEDASDRGGVA